MREDIHIHCLICGTPKNIDKKSRIDLYVCDRCMKSFPDDYILYRINCRKNNIHHKSFDFLEARLTFGDLSKVEINEENWMGNEEVLCT